MFLGGVGKIFQKVYDATLTALRVVSRHERIVKASLFNQVVAASTAYYTTAVDLNGVYSDSLVFFVEDSTSDITNTASVEMSPDNTTWFDFKIWDGGAVRWYLFIVGSLKVAIAMPFKPVAARYLRLKIQTGAGVLATETIEVSVQEVR